MTTYDQREQHSIAIQHTSVGPTQVCPIEVQSLVCR